MAGQKWKEVADNVNSYESFSEKCPGSEERERAFSEITRGLKSKDEKGRNFTLLAEAPFPLYSLS